MAESESQEKSHWTVDKRIPVALLFAFFLQSAIGFIWVGGLAQTVATHDKTIEDFRANGTPGVREKLTRLEERTDGINQRFEGFDQRLNRIENGIERLDGKFDQLLEPKRK